MSLTSVIECPGLKNVIPQKDMTEFFSTTGNIKVLYVKSSYSH